MASLENGGRSEESWVITGGIACGKSEFVKELSRIADRQVMIWSADEAVREIYENVKLAEELEIVLKAGKIRNIDGGVDRQLLRQRLIDSEDDLRHQLEDWVHPQVRKAMESARFDFFKDFFEEEDRSGIDKKAKVFVAEVPIYYESTERLVFNKTIVIAASAWMQIKRMQEKRGLTYHEALKMINMQMDLPLKMNLADVVIWNVGSVNALKAQAEWFWREQQR
jgi:dephospho-CoA kinase